MALWQYMFRVLTKNSFYSLQDDNPSPIEDYQFEDELFWQFEPIDKSFFEEIGSILGVSKSWSNEIDLYGNQESNCFEVLFDKRNVVVSVSFRIDFTSNYDEVLSRILEFCIFKGLLVLDESLKVVPLNLELAICIIENAPQVRRYKELKGR